MTHAVAAWPPDRPGGIVVGQTTHMWCPRVRGRPCYPLLQRPVVVCVGNPGSMWGNVRSLRACISATHIARVPCSCAASS
eukprot:2307926-Prymnesium_polylepis.1